MNKPSTPSKTTLDRLGPEYGGGTNPVEWATPPHVFKVLHEEFDFTLDVAASDKQHVLERYFTAADDGLSKSWAGERCYMNPPYGRDMSKWIEKANYETMNKCPLVVGLLPVRASTKWFHNHVLPNAEIRFIKGRLKFGSKKKSKKLDSAPFASMIVIWRNLDIQPVGLWGFDEVSSFIQETLEDESG